VGFGSSRGANALPEKVRMLLLRRGVQRAQDRLASALVAFRKSIAATSR